MSNLNFSINGKSVTPTKYLGKARQFLLTVDEPQNLGGQDAAANPVEYILAGLAGCLNVVIHIVAKEQQIQLSTVHININGDINPAKFLGTDDSQRAGFRSLNVHIDIVSVASKEQIDKLIATVEKRCPVNDTLQNTTPIHFNVHHKESIPA